MSISLCFINFQINRNILTWSGKINSLGQVHSESHENKCRFFGFGISVQGLFLCLTSCFHQIVHLSHHLSRVPCNPVLSQLAIWASLVRSFGNSGESCPLRHTYASLEKTDSFLWKGIRYHRIRPNLLIKSWKIKSSCHGHKDYWSSGQKEKKWNS